ncbi:MAG: hypothetical protein L0Z62_10470 [Gemmataceae bacterium]|nr:hypothetical protein [Gemmataceae bacterium]
MKPWHLLAVLLWGAAAFGVLSLANLPGGFTHALCGPWGCFPPLQALGAMHLFWVLLLIPILGWPSWGWPPERVKTLGTALFLLGIGGLLTVAVGEMLTWVPPGGESWRYLPQRILYAVAVLSDVPLVQVTVGGLVCRFIGKRRDELRPLAADTAASPSPPVPSYPKDQGSAPE